MKYIQEKSVVTIGIVLVLLPYSGFPRDWKSTITIILGVLLVFVGGLIWRKARPVQAKKEMHTETFTETL